MGHRGACATLYAAGSFLLLFPLPAAAQLPPQGYTADPSYPQFADWTHTETGGGNTFTIHRRYYYDCGKAKWILVLDEGNTTKYTPEKIGATLISGPPPGSERSPSEPDHAFNPTTGEYYHYDRDNKQWVDSKTGKPFPMANLCPPPAGTTPPPPLPAGVGVGVEGGQHQDHGEHHPHGTGYDPTDLPPTAKPAPHD